MSQGSKPSPGDDLLKELEAGKRRTLVILPIPSHDKDDKKLSNQDQWADAALDLFAELYSGATAFATYAGIYRDKVRNKDLKDKPILIESYAEMEKVKDARRSTKLVEFMKRMGRETKQAAVIVIIDNFLHEITEF
jgi:hypothetical protein